MSALPSEKADPDAGCSYEELKQLEKALSKARMQCFSSEKHMLDAAKRSATNPQLEKLKEAGRQTTEEVQYYQDRLTYKREANDMSRGELERLRSQKAHLESEVLNIQTPTFRIATRDIDGGPKDSGYLSVSGGAVLVATNLEDDYLYGFELHEPRNKGWFPISATDVHHAHPAKLAADRDES